jgi:ryanodine receptor 2
MVQKNKNGYVPSPMTLEIDQLPEVLRGMLEKMAENVHEGWAYQKMAEGWSFGEIYDRMLKKHPSLKPYAELDESQKNYDRNTALATISFMMNEGYVIKK